MTSVTDQELVEVHLLGLPLDLLTDAQERSDELTREFSHVLEGDTDAVPARLIALSRQLRNQYGTYTAAVQEQINLAVQRGDATMDATFRVPRDAATAATRLWALLDEADEFCRAGDLLTLVPSPDVVRLRHWLLSQFIDQAAGAEPVPWPEYAEAPPV